MWKAAVLWPYYPYFSLCITLNRRLRNSCSAGIHVGPDWIQSEKSLRVSEQINAVPKCHVPFQTWKGEQSFGECFLASDSLDSLDRQWENAASICYSLLLSVSSVSSAWIFGVTSEFPVAKIEWRQVDLLYYAPPDPVGFEEPKPNNLSNSCFHTPTAEY